MNQDQLEMQNRK